MPRKAGVELADPHRDIKTFGEILSIPESNKFKEKGAWTSCAPSHTRDPLHHTCVGTHKRSETRQSMMARRVESYAGAGAVARPPKREPSIHQMHAFTKHRNKS